MQMQEQWIDDARYAMGTRRRRSSARRFLGRLLLVLSVPALIGWWLA